MFPSTAKVWQTLNIGKSSRVPSNLIFSGAVYGPISGHCLGVVCQTLPVLRYCAPSWACHQIIIYSHSPDYHRMADSSGPAAPAGNYRADTINVVTHAPYTQARRGRHGAHGEQAAIDAARAVEPYAHWKILANESDSPTIWSYGAHREQAAIDAARAVQPYMKHGEVRVCRHHGDGAATEHQARPLPLQV